MFLIFDIPCCILAGHLIKDAKSYGWQLDAEPVKHSWEELRQGVQDHIGSLNWGYRVQLRDNNVKYFNAYAKFKDANTITVSIKSLYINVLPSSFNFGFR